MCVHPPGFVLLVCVCVHECVSVHLWCCFSSSVHVSTPTYSVCFCVCVCLRCHCLASGGFIKAQCPEVKSHSSPLL